MPSGSFAGRRAGLFAAAVHCQPARVWTVTFLQLGMFSDGEYGKIINMTAPRTGRLLPAVEVRYAGRAGTPDGEEYPAEDTASHKEKDSR